MKRICCILLLMMLALPALAAENPFSPYVLPVPADATLTETEGTFTFVRGTTRVVAMVIERVPDATPSEAILRMMTQFEPQAILGDDLTMAEGFVGVQAVNADKFGEGMDQINVMILSADGSLLILSGYSLEGDEEQVHALLDTLLSALTAEGKSIVLFPEASADAE